MGSKKGCNPMTVAELEKAKRLAALGNSYRQIGLAMNRSDKTIKKALTKTPEVISEVVELKEQIASMYEDLSKRFLQSITDADIKAAHVRDRVVSAGICTDKQRILRGGEMENWPTTITIQVVNHPGELPTSVSLPINVTPVEPQDQDG